MPVKNKIILAVGITLIWGWVIFCQQVQAQGQNDTTEETETTVRSSYTTLTRAERVCIGECPQITGDLSCWPAQGNISQPPFGGFSHGGQDAFDISAPTGTKIFAPVSGIIIYNFHNSYGCHAKISTDQIPEAPGGATLIFAHMVNSSCSGRTGTNMPISAGDLIGLVGSTGYSTGSHLHYEFRPVTQGSSVLQRYLQLGKGASNASAPQCGR